MNKNISWKFNIALILSAISIISPVLVISACCGSEPQWKRFFNVDNSTLLEVTDEGKKQKNLDIPDVVTVINPHSFDDCSLLESVSIPASIVFIPSNIFDRCPKLISSNVRNNSPVLFRWWVNNHKYGGKTMMELASIDLNEYKNSNQQPFTTIVANTFENCFALNLIKIPHTITTIDPKAFHGLSSKTKYFAFGKKVYQDLLRANIKDNQIVHHEGNFVISTNVIIGLTPEGRKQTDLVILDGITQIKSIAFINCPKLKNITIPKSVNYIEDNTFSECKALENIYLSREIKEINEKAFHGLAPNVKINASIERSKRDIINVAGDTEKLAVEGDFVFENDILTGLTPKGKKQTNLFIPNGTTEIRTTDFRNCPALRLVTIPNTVKTIIDTAFAGCAANVFYEVLDEETANILLASKSNIKGAQLFSPYLIMDGVNPAYLKGVSAKGRKLSKLFIPENVIAINIHAFTDDKALKNINIPKTVASIAVDAFDGCTNLKSDGVVSHSPALFYWWVRNHLYQVEQWQTLSEMSIIDLTQFKNSDGAPFKIISNAAFWRCNKLKKIFIPNDIDSINAYAFKECAGLKEMILPEGVITIGEEAFYKCKSLQKIVIPASADNIGKKIIDKCDALKSSGIINHSKVLFDGWVQRHKYQKKKLNQMTSINLNQFTNSDNIPFDTIGQCAFKDCKLLKKIIISNSIKIIALNAFDGCTALECVTIPANVENIADNAFVNCHKNAKFYVANEVLKKQLLNANTAIDETQVIIQ